MSKNSKEVMGRHVAIGERAFLVPVMSIKEVSEVGAKRRWCVCQERVQETSGRGGPGIKS